MSGDKATTTRSKPVRHPLSALDKPVLPTLISQMRADIVVNEESQIWLLHDAPLTEIVKWAEYDLDYNKIWLILLSGRQQELGIVIPDEMRDRLQAGRQIYLIQMRDKNFIDCNMVPLMVRGAYRREAEHG